MSTTVRFAESIDVTRATTTSSGSPSGKSSFGMRTAAGMSAKRSSTLRRPIVRSISSSSEGIRCRLRDGSLLRIWNPPAGTKESVLPRRVPARGRVSVDLETPDESKVRAALEDGGRCKRDRVLVRFRRSIALKGRRHEREKGPVSHNRGRGAIDFLRDSFDASATSDYRVRNRFLARREEVEIGPRPAFQLLVFRLGDSRFIGGPLFQTRSLGDQDMERLGKQEGTLDAATQGAGEYGGGGAHRASARESAQLRLPVLRERRPVENRSVGRAGDFPMSHQDEGPGHPAGPPGTTAADRNPTPSAQSSSVRI